MLKTNAGKIFVLAFLHFICDFYGGMRTPLAEPTLTTQLGASLGDVLLAFMLASILTNLVQPLGAFFLPKHGLPILLILCPLLAISAALIGFAGSTLSLAMFLCMASIGIGLLHPEGLLTAQGLSGSNHGLAISVFLSAGLLGYSSGGVTSAYWATTWGMSTYWLLGIPAIIAVVLVLISGLHKTEGHAATSMQAHECHAITFPKILLLGTAIASSILFFIAFITPYLVRSFGDKAQIWGGVFIFCFGIGGLFGSFLWGYLSKKTRCCYIIAMCQIFSIPVLYYLIQIQNPKLVIFFGIYLGFFIGAISPLAAVLSRNAPGENTRLRAGLIIGGSWGLGSLMLIVAGKWVDTYPKGEVYPVKACIAFSMVLMLFTFILAVFFSRKEKTPSPDGEEISALPIDIPR
ncbi:MAG: MFS transporter [Planctomycetes bacterium]|nr:MFS transporter [Planctomycetota bacterium]